MLGRIRRRCSAPVKVELLGGTVDEVCIETFRSHLEADLARSALSAFGIDSRLESDTAGGSYPNLEGEGVRLLVLADQVQAAEEVLASLTEVAESDFEQVETVSTPDEPMTARPPGLTLALVVAAAFLGFLVGRSGPEQSTLSDDVIETDQNGDGAADGWAVYEAGILQEYRVDRNFDGRIDSWLYYHRGVIDHAELDEDFDTQVDGWLEYEFNDISRATFDFDRNGVPDYGIEYQFGVPSLGTLHPNGGPAEREEVFVGGMVREVYRLSPDDGRVLLRSYDRQGREQDLGP